MKRLLRYLRNYKLFNLAVLAAIVALILQLTHLHVIADWILGSVAIFESLPLLWGMYQDVRSGTYGIDILAATAIISSVVLKQYWAAIVIVLMLTGGEALESFAERRAKVELASLLERAPQKANLIKSRKTVEVKAGLLKIGDKIIIKPGELVPADAEILEGSSSLDESSLTGESVPQTKHVKDKILSGSLNIDGSLTARVVANAADSQYQQIVKLVRSAAASRSPFVRLADRYSLPFTITAYAIAIAAWVLTGEAIRFLEVIVVATPCPLILAPPIALISGMSRASRYGIIVKNGSAMERLAEAKTMAFDKTGTLTRGLLNVDKVVAYGGFKEEEVLATAASLELNSNHVLALAIVQAASSQGLKVTKAKHVKEIAGGGLVAHIKNQDVIVGRQSLLAERIEFPPKFKPLEQTAVYVAIGGELAGAVGLTDELRPEAEATLKRVHQLGIRNTLMITGDNHSIAQKIAKQLGIDEVHAEMLPADKLHALDGIKLRPVAFVGDGVNDAPILTAASVGIALGARGSTAASESADMVIMLNDLSRVAAALAIAKRTFAIAKQSILIGIALSLILMAVFATGRFTALTGAIVQEVVDVVVIFNALRAHTHKAIA